MDKQSIYLISAGVVFILFVIFLIILLKKKRVINLQKQVQEFERQRNLIVSTPIAAELAKIEVIVKNEKLESKYEEWKERYRVIKENRFQVITDMLLEIDGLIDANDIKNAKQKIILQIKLHMGTLINILNFNLKTLKKDFKNLKQSWKITIIVK